MASARSTFFDYSNFSRVARRFGTDAEDSMAFEVVPIDILPWDRHALDRYAKARSKEPEAIVRKVIGLTATAPQILQTPFFVAKIMDLLEEGNEVPDPKAATHQVIATILEREVNKLRDRFSRPILTKEDHEDICEALAEEMWWQETRELDEATVKTVAELAIEGKDYRVNCCVSFSNECHLIHYLHRHRRSSVSSTSTTSRGF